MSNENEVATAIGTIGEIIGEEAKAACASVPREEAPTEVEVQAEVTEASTEQPAQETKAEQPKREKKAKPTSSVPKQKERPTIKLYPGMNKDGEYVSYKLSNTLITGGVKTALDNVTTNLFSQLAVQYENTDVTVQVWGDMDNSWFGKSRFCDRLPKLSIINGVFTSLDMAYVNWLEGIHVASITRLGMLRRAGASGIDSYEFLTGERIPILIGIAVGAPTGISYRVGEQIQGMLLNINDIAGKTGVYVINIAQPGAKITQNDLSGMKCAVTTPTYEEHSRTMYGDDRAKHGTLPKGYVWSIDTTRDDEYSDTRLLVPEYTHDKIVNIIEGKIHPNRCVFAKGKLKQIKLLHGC